MAASINLTAAGYKGKFGKVSISEVFEKDDWYEDMFFKSGDPRINDKFLMRTPEPAILIIIAYLIFVVVAPKVMEKREPFNFKILIIIYNFALVFLSAFMAVEFFLTSFLLGYSYGCQGVDWTYSTDHLSTRLVNVQWWFFFSKIIELADTVFFILRKKNNQVTFLHVYHHATMIANWWLAAKYIPVGQSFFVGMINSSIHALMYVYYGLAAIGPSMQRFLWWKKYMTVLQLVQFVAVISHTGYNKFFRTDCDYPFLYNSIVFYYAISMVVLFTDFYCRTYTQHKRQPKKDSVEKQHLNNNGHLNHDKLTVKDHDKDTAPELSANGDNNLRIRHR